MTFAGVDGCSGGWIVVYGDGDKENCLCGKMVEDINALLSFQKEMGIEVIAIDIPIGLPSKENPQRRVDITAKKNLKNRASSVFMAPILELVKVKDKYNYKNDFGYICEISKTLSSGKKISKQVFCLFNKLLDVNDHIEEIRRNKIREFHPELCWSAEVKCSKKTIDGFNSRIKDLASHLGWKEEHLCEFIQKIREGRCKLIARDDVVDALCGLVVAKRIASNRGIASIKESETDPACEIYYIPHNDSHCLTDIIP